MNFNEICNHDGTDCCPNIDLIGDGLCNSEVDIITCNYDGGDCCLTEQINDGFCDPVNYNRMGKFDGDDCYCEYKLIENGICDLVNNKAMCNYDGGDCCDMSKIGDGLCYSLNNNPKCSNDGGDCCEGDTTKWGNTNGCDEDLNNAACLFDKGACCQGDVTLISDGVCQYYNNNPACIYDGGDCSECLNPDLIKNGQCNAENLNHLCQFDGLDCCSNSSLVDNGVCDFVSFNEACRFDGSDCCPLPQYVGDGNCNVENDIGICNYDGGDCCDPGGYGSGWCYWKNNNRMCDYDGGDCCNGNVDTIGDGICHDENNNGQCSFDGGDCCLAPMNSSSCLVCECITQEAIQPFDPCPLFTKIGDGFCHDENNNLICSYDGGDCCGLNIITTNCSVCQCFEGMTQSPHVLCPHHSKIGDGICQDENNIDLCLYDGGDCCLAEMNGTQCKECQCLSQEKVFDPCPKGDRIGDGICDLSNNNTICSFDGGDCSK